MNSMSARPPYPRFRSLRRVTPRASGAWPATSRASSRVGTGAAGLRGSPRSTARPNPPVAKITRARVSASRSQAWAEPSQVLSRKASSVTTSGPEAPWGRSRVSTV